MSPTEAPPFAKQGLPKNPVKNRKTRSPAKLLTTAVGMDRITKSKKVGDINPAAAYCCDFAERCEEKRSGAISCNVDNEAKRRRR